jgi:hypothetical protein
MQTALVEACAWDEGEASRLMLLAKEVIEELDDTNLPNQEQLEKLLYAKLDTAATSSQIFIVKQIVFAEFKKAIDDFSKAYNAIEN